MKLVSSLLVILFSLPAFADSSWKCEPKAIAAVRCLSRINGVKLNSIKITGRQVTEGDGDRLLLEARNRTGQVFKFTADVGQSEGPCRVFSVSQTEAPF